MLTQENYIDLITQAKPCSQRLYKELDQTELFFKHKMNSYSLYFENHSETMIEEYVLQAFKSGKLPIETKVYTKVNLSFWKITNGTVEKEKNVSCKIFKIVNEREITCKKITEEEFTHWEIDPKFIMTSSNIPDLFSSDSCDGLEVVKSFHHTIFSTAPILADPKNIEWRIEGMQLYQLEAVDYIYRTLKSNGFNIHMHLPYIIVKKSLNSHEYSLHSCQAVGVSIPRDAFIEKNATFQNTYSYTGNLSVHNVLVNWRDTSEKISLPTKQDIDLKKSIDQVLDEILKELVFVANYGSLIKRYAHKITFLDNSLHQELLEKLIDLGFDAKIDSPFIFKELNRFHQHIYNQYILIDLP